MIRPFRFKYFDIQQSTDVFRVGTDGVLLGALANIDSAKTVLEVGTGTGLISMMVAQRNVDTKVLAVDIDKAAVELAAQNFLSSPFSERLEVIETDFKRFQSLQKFDAILSNPPYFEENDSVKDRIARQKILLNFEDLISNAVDAVSEMGTISVIIPADQKDLFVDTASLHGLYWVRNLQVYGREGKGLKRSILEFSKQDKPLVCEDFIIEKGPREYSDQYLEATKDFHVFSK